MAIEVKRLSAPKISPDGTSVKFTAHATKGADLVAVFKSSQLESLTRSLIELMTSAKIAEVAALHGTETYGMKDQGGWTDAPQAVLVRRFQEIDNPNND